MKNRNLAPLYYSIFVIIGMYIGIFFSNRMMDNSSSSNPINFILPEIGNDNKLNQIINFIDRQYVDSVKREELVEKAIETILSELDPHSYYINQEELSAYTDPLEGKFEGIGVEFMIQKDTVVVINTIENGPSAKVGIKAGDRIVRVDTANFAGIGLSNSLVMKTLRGESGSKVNVKIKRKTSKELLDFTISRGSIPLTSIDAAYAINDSVAYVKIARFAKMTHREFTGHLDSLLKENDGIQNIIIDLRNNGGGYLDAAIEISDELLPKGDLIVYTKGRTRPEKRYYSRREGKYSAFKISVLINENSASASEIVAGAMQDNDRGLIYGRRSFGKGLVQEHINLRDESALRLTVARYYTPTGRCIQKPYGEEVDYRDDYMERVERGELYSKDSIEVNDTLKYVTPKGRVVYGGGGIVPDVFVSLDTTGYSYLLSNLIYSGLLNQYTFIYVDGHREELSAYTNAQEFESKFEVENSLLDSFFEFSEVKKQDYNRLSAVSKKLLKDRFKANIARDLFGLKGYYYVINATDSDLQQALKVRP